MLLNINSFNKPIFRDSVVYFLMSNNEDLYDRHWLNIKTNSSGTLKDKTRGNIPEPVNKKVRVRVQRGPAFLVIVPTLQEGRLTMFRTALSRRTTWTRPRLGAEREPGRGHQPDEHKETRGVQSVQQQHLAERFGQNL